MVSPISYGPHTSHITKIDSLLAVDQLNTILLVEQKYRVLHVLCQAVSEKNSCHPYGDWRRKICQWSFKVIDHFKLDREVVSSAMNILDRYLASGNNCLDRTEVYADQQECLRTIDSRTFQLTAMTSLYLSMKISDNEESQYSSSRKLKLNSFVELSRGQFCADEITEMERTILSKLQWKVFPPTPMTAVSFLLYLMPSRKTLPYTCHKSYDLVLHVLHELARYLTELSVCHGSICASNTSSQVAYASILLSMELLTPIALPFDAREEFNETVASISLLSGGTILTHQNKAIRYLQEVLRDSFWPEMLVDDCEYHEIGHPISMAKDFGLLDMSYIVSSHSSTVPSNTLLSHHHSLSDPFKEPDLEGSPVCVNRHF